MGTRLRRSGFGIRYSALLALLGGTLSAGAAHAIDTYAGGVLQIPTLAIGSRTFSNVTVQVTSILTMPSGYMPNGNIDTYDPSTGKLTVQSVLYGGHTYYNAVVTVSPVVTIGSMTGSDTYQGAGQVLTIPRIEVGGTAYDDVNVHVVPTSIVVHGGMPGALADSVSLSPGGVTINIPAIEFGGAVYTNIVVGATLTGLSYAGSHRPIYAFGSGTAGDGMSPYGSLVMDTAGNLYGTTSGGGAAGMGTVYRITPSGTESVIYSFKGGTDGQAPQAGLCIDAAGNLYGTTTSGGTNKAGTVFELSAAGTESVLHHFTGGTDGSEPLGGLVLDAAGNLYGTTLLGGGSANVGVVFELVPSTGVLTVLHAFGSVTGDGTYPSATLLLDPSGNLYGTTEFGGSGSGGTVFKVNPATRTETIVYDFKGGTDGGNPLYAGVVLDASGNLYGTTFGGGAAGAGTVFRIAPDGTKTTLYNFAGGTDGSAPTWGVTLDNAGNLYGTAYNGGTSGYGAVFRVTPSGTESVAYSFIGSGDGQYPNGGLIRDGNGHLYGVTESGGSKATGTVFQID